jgi:hypothetical protein
MKAQEIREIAARKKEQRKEALRKEMAPVFARLEHAASEYGETFASFSVSELPGTYQVILREDGFKLTPTCKGQAIVVSA